MPTEKTIHLSTGQTLTIRRATPEDAARTIEYVKKVAGESDNLTFGPDEFQYTVEQQRETLQTFQGEGKLYIIAEVEGEIVSLLSFGNGKRPRTQHEGEFGLTVQKKFWGLGIATQMMRYLLEWAKQTRLIRKINLKVREDNEAAIAVYQKVGFREEGRITRQMLINGRFYDAFVMGIPIDPLED